MSKNVVIVESPAKAKTIEGYLGKDYVVASSFGHVRDLPKGDNAIDVENGYTPTYEIPKDKKEVIKTLKKLTKDAETIYLASDDDREGEAISWHLKSALDLDDQRTRRIVFREITKNAILNAIQTPRGINLDLVNAQQARRILDRLVGFEISPVLWKKIKGGLSAGRVQSVAVRLVVEREREIDKFEATSAFRVTAEFEVEKGKLLKAELPKKFSSEDEAREFLEACLKAEFEIADLQTKPSKKSPAPPFTTSTLQQEASRKLGFSVAQTMSLAQRLYESGKISYMRTDSVNLSEDAIKAAKEEIVRDFGEKYSKERRFKTKSAGAQEAHEAIRPTDFGRKEAGSDGREQRLYELIWKRAVASQMSEAQLEKTTARIAVSTSDEQLTAQGEVVKFDGFLKLYIESSDDEDDRDEASGMLPPLAIGQQLKLQHMTARQTFTRHPARYTEASLVKKLEEMGIGRPSTYAPTISTIQKRGYIIKESRDGSPRDYRELHLKDGSIAADTFQEITGAEKNKLFPTNNAMVVNDFLVQHFPNVIDFNFTANVEKEFDEIAHGKIEWQKMIDGFYKSFHERVENSEHIDRVDAGSARLIGEHPENGKPVYAKLGRYGAYVQIGDMDDDEKPRFASLRHGQFIENIALDDALELFKLPREVGFYEDEPISAAVGRYGPYLRHKNKFYSLDEDDPLQVTEEKAVEIIEAKRKEDAQRIIKDFETDPSVQILNGKWGPYIKVGKKNVKIPKDKKPEELTLEECLELSEKAPAKKKGGSRRKK